MGRAERESESKRCEELTGALSRIVVAILNVTQEKPTAVTVGISFPTGDDKAAVYCATLAVSPEAERAHAHVLARSLEATPTPVPPANAETPA